MAALHSSQILAPAAANTKPRSLRAKLGPMPLLSLLHPKPAVPVRLARALACATLGWGGRAAAGPALASEHVTLRNGFAVVCDHGVADGATTRLFLGTDAGSYIDVPTAEIVSMEWQHAQNSILAPAQSQTSPQASSIAEAESIPGDMLSPAALHEVLQGAGTAHDLDVDLLASVVHAESGSRIHARSRVGAQGLMQLMPGTAAELGVHDSFAPAQNVGGGAAYLDTLLHRYHENLAFALAAYNAGPAAVDRWHGVPPYRETRAYVARIIHEFNRRYAARQLVLPAAFAASPSLLSAAKP